MVVVVVVGEVVDYGVVVRVWLCVLFELYCVVGRDGDCLVGVGVVFVVDDVWVLEVVCGNEVEVSGGISLVGWGLDGLLGGDGWVIVLNSLVIDGDVFDVVVGGSFWGVSECCCYDIDKYCDLK